MALQKWNPRLFLFVYGGRSVLRSWSRVLPFAPWLAGSRNAGSFFWDKNLG